MSSIADYLSERALRVQESGIRRIFNLASTLVSPLNLSIGQPDFDVPGPIKQAAIQAITSGHNGYTVTQGLPELRSSIASRFGQYYTQTPSVLITSGVSGGLVLALMATINPGDEVLFPDPYFVSYPNLVHWFDGKPVPVSTYPDFTLQPDRLEAAITLRSKVLLLNSPNNPTGVIYDDVILREICELAEKHNLLIISDEIYRDLAYDGPVPSPAQYAPDRTLILGGFGKSYGMTGWRMGYVVGPSELVMQMGNMQQYTFVCAPSMAQHACLTALETDISRYVEAYRRKRDLVAEGLKDSFEFTTPSGGFYFFLKAPEGYATGTEFVEAAIKKNLLCVPGGVFSRQDTHIRISYAIDDEQLKQACDVLRSMVHP